MTLIYDTRCLECGSEYCLSPRGVRLGPLDAEIVTGSEDRGGITCLKTERLYTGGVTTVSCPICSLSVSFASDLAPHSFAFYFECAKDLFGDLKMDKVFESSPARCTFRGFPVHCPSCDTVIDAPNLRRRCLKCGSSQLQVLRSRPDSTDIQTAQDSPTNCG